MGQQQRQYKREPILLQVSGYGDTFLVQNLSEGGMFVVTDRVLRVGTPLLLTIRAVGAAAFQVNCTVRWVGKRGAPPKLGLGVEFDRPSEQTRRQIAQILEAVRAPNHAVLEDRHGLLYVDANANGRALFTGGIRTLCSRLFNDPDFFVVEAIGDGRGALTELRQRVFTLTICDLTLPDMSGAALIQCIRSEISQAMPVFATGTAYPGDQEDALAAGADLFLPKPLQLPGLFNTIIAMVQISVP